MNWEYVKVSELAEVVTDYVANGSFADLANNVKYKDEEDYAVLIRLVDYNNGFKGPFVFIDQKAYDFLSKSKLYGDEIIISNVGANVGTVFKCPHLKYKMSLAPNSIMVKFKGINDFYYYWLTSPIGQFSLKTIVTGSAQPKFNKTNFREMKVPVPDLPTQRKIAAVLSALDNKIALNRRINTKLEQMAKRLYDYWFVQFDFPNEEGKPYKSSGGNMVDNAILKRKIPEGWEVKKVADFMQLVTKGTTPSTAGFSFTDEGVNFIKVECIENGNVLMENVMHISNEANEALKRSQLQENDILVTIAGRLGSPAVVTKRILPANTNQAVGFIRLKKEYNDLTNYIFSVISSDEMQKRVQFLNAQSIQKNLTLPDLENITFVYDSKIVAQYCERVKAIYSKIDNNVSEITALTALRDRLLPMLMNGQVTVK